ncbi:MAG: hypothetical protein K5657_03400 [Desulfovibrio sp.]|nr:hypothetical protein [Desulfovibrio sp.]
MQKERTTRIPWTYIFVLLLLLLAVFWAVYELRIQAEEREAALLLEKTRLEERLRTEEARLEFLRSLLSLSPCEAKARWAKP